MTPWTPHPVPARPDPARSDGFRPPRHEIQAPQAEFTDAVTMREAVRY
ncbi:hypothetical protein ATKI12_1669 [Kitasatospora sp. Ki12]